MMSFSVADRRLSVSPSHAFAPVPVTIVCGFLGAGKTTLLQRILADPQGIRYGVLLNDFGAVNIDASLLVEAAPDQVALSNGCICCSIRGDLAAALETLLARTPAPERILIETSGVSRPLPVADAIAGAPFHGRAKLDAIFCLVDAGGFGDLDYAATELAIDQALGADMVILNKTDIASPAQISATEATLRAASPRIRLLATSQADLPRDLLFAAHNEREPHPHAHVHDHGEEFEAWHWRSSQPIHEAPFRAAVRKLPPGIVRAKGVVQITGANGRLVFHLVGKRTEFAHEPHTPPSETAVVAIGRRGSFDPAALTRLFEACLA